IINSIILDFLSDISMILNAFLRQNERFNEIILIVGKNERQSSIFDSVNNGTGKRDGHSIVEDLKLLPNRLK
ncbi:MAG: hypothetical protein LBH92_08000, partial [Bacteroidales bacterium]|nr:hypothetical protein [Bacteroidales bacterium]